MTRGFEFLAVGKTGVYRVWPWWLYIVWRLLGPGQEMGIDKISRG